MSYYPGQYAGGPVELYLQQELERIAEVLMPIEDGEIAKRHVAPEKPRFGLFYADGADWNPGNGEGVYVYDEDSAAFELLGTHFADVERYGAVGDGPDDNYTAINNAILSLPAPGGGVVLFPQAKNYRCDTGLTWDDKCVQFVGQGNGSQPGTGTRITFPVGVVGINPQNGASGFGARSGVHRIRIVGSDVGLGTNDGVLMQCNSGIVDNVVVEAFGRYGVNIFSDGTVAKNANLCRGDHLRCKGNFGGGFHTEGADSNAGTFSMLDMDGNGAFGIWEGSNIGNTYLGVHLNANTTGGIRIGPGGNNRMYGIYFETENKPALTIDAGSAGKNVVEFLTAARPDGASPIVDNSGAVNFILLEAGGLHWTRLFIANELNTLGYLDLTPAILQLRRGALMRLQNAAEDANWDMQVLANKTLQVSSAQLAALNLANQLVLPASTTSLSSLRVPHGVAPTSPVNGDMWTATAGTFVRINGVTRQVDVGVTNYKWVGPNGNTQAVNQSAALQFFDNDVDYRTKMDLSGYTQARLISNISVVGFAGAFHEIRYFTSHSATVGDYLTIGSSAVSNDHDALGIVDTGWINLVSGAKIDNAFVALVMDDGNGVLDPAWLEITMYFR